jgi:hypothetical protein
MSRRMLMDKITWAADWPAIENAVPGETLRKGPEF